MRITLFILITVFATCTLAMNMYDTIDCPRLTKWYFSRRPSPFVEGAQPKLPVVPTPGIRTAEDDAQFAEKRKLYLSRMRGPFVDGERPKLSGVPIPDIPISEDYSQFSEIMSRDFTSISTLMVFKEMFHTDSEDRIIGVTDRISDPKLHSAIDGEYRLSIEDTFKAVDQKDMATKYYRIRPWVDAFLHEMRSNSVPMEEGGDYTPYEWAVHMITDFHRPYTYKIVYSDILVDAAIRKNFEEGDPDRDVLWKYTRCPEPQEPTEATKWFYGNYYDYATKVADSVLVAMKPALLAYLEDVKDLMAKGKLG